MKQYSANLAKGKEIIEYYVNELMNEGSVTNLPIWTEPLSTSPINQTQELTTTISANQDPSLIAARRRLSTQDASNIFTSASPPKASGITTTAAANYSAVSDEFETFQIDENTQEKQRKLNSFFFRPYFLPSSNCRKY